MKDVCGKNALLTGAAGGLGHYVAHSLAAEKVNLALVDINSEKLDAMKEELSTYDVRIETYRCDLTDSAARATLVEKYLDDFETIDVLINNAGIEWISSYTDLTEQEIEGMVQINLLAPMLLTRLILPHMEKQSNGHVVTMSSMGGVKGSPFSATYAATKAALIQWSQSIRAEYFETGISASVICPGFVAEAGMFAVYNRKAPKIAGETTPEEVAAAVLRAIIEDKSQILVSPGGVSVKMMQLVNAINPDLVTHVLRKRGLHAFYKDQAEDNQRSRMKKEE